MSKMKVIVVSDGAGPTDDFFKQVARQVTGDVRDCTPVGVELEFQCDHMRYPNHVIIFRPETTDQAVLDFVARVKRSLEDINRLPFEREPFVPLVTH